MNNSRTRKTSTVMGVIALIVFVIGGLVMVASSGDNPTAADSSGDDNDPAEEAEVDPVTGLPIVGNDESSSEDDPLSGAESNDDPRTPVVRDGQTVDSWTQLDELLGEDDSYTECVSETVPGFDWDDDIDAHVEYEAQDDSDDTRFILAVNVDLSDEQVRDKASADVEEDLSGLNILRLDSIINTRGFADGGGCEEFVDRRSQVRVSLGTLVFNDDGTVKGLSRDGGVLTDCHNPWRVTPEPEPEPEPTPSQEPSPTPTGKDHRRSPVSDDTEHEDERVRPRESEDPAPPSPSPEPPPAPAPDDVEPTDESQPIPDDNDGQPGDHGTSGSTTTDSGGTETGGSKGTTDAEETSETGQTSDGARPEDDSSREEDPFG